MLRLPLRLATDYYGLSSRFNFTTVRANMKKSLRRMVLFRVRGYWLFNVEKVENKF
jgi:hypothetical protein